MAVVGFIGLGVMGAPMAKNILAKGHSVQGFDVAEAARAAHAINGGTAAETAAAAADGVDFLITMLPNGGIVREALFGAGGALETLPKSALHIDMSTIHPNECDGIQADMAAKGYASIDAPVGRTSLQAIDGTLLLMVGAPPAEIERARPVLMCMGDTLVDCGGPGKGMRMKIVNNLMSTSLNALTAEVLTLSDASGVDRKLAIEVMSGTAAGRGHMTTTYPSAVLSNNLDPVFMVDLALKDLNIALDVGGAVGVDQTLAKAAAARYGEAQQAGLGRRDWTSLYAMLRKACLGEEKI